MHMSLAVLHSHGSTYYVYISLRYIYHMFVFLFHNGKQKVHLQVGFKENQDSKCVLCRHIGTVSEV